MCVQYIGGCSVHRGCSVHWEGVFSTSGWYHEYIGGCSVHRRDTMSTSGGYHEYIGRCSVHRGDIMSTSGMFSTSEFSIEIERILSSCSPTCIMISLRCTEHPPMYSWYTPDVLMVSLWCTEHPPMYWTSPDVLMVSPHIYHDIPPMYWNPPMYSWYPPDVLMISPRCTEHPPMYWTHIIQGANIEKNLSKPFQLIFSLYAWTCLRLPTIKIYQNQALATKSLFCRQAFVAHC